LAQAGVSYVGISLDGLRATNDRFRGRGGAFAAALAGMRHCRRAGLKVGLRVTLNRYNAGELDDIFALIVEENIERVCFYHLVYTGRARTLQDDDLTPEQTREVVDRIIDHTAALHAQGRTVEVLTVDNHADGAYLYLRMRREGHRRAEAVRELLSDNGGNRSGEGIAAVNWDGQVHPDQFWRHVNLGNVRERPFSAVWTDPHNELLRQLRNRRRFLKGRCRTCRFLNICNGNFRVRAEAITGDVWAPDPACYLTDEEIGPDRESESQPTREISPD